METGRTYRTWLALRAAVVVAAAFWGAALVALAWLPSSEPRLLAGAAGFALFFAACGVVYGRLSITVTEEGIVARTPFRRRRVRFEDILQVVVIDGPGGRVYSVLTRRGLVRFTSLVSHHRELFETLLERARLTPHAA